MALSLTPRQEQILRLLESGKVNKEIAEELGIGIGTVKQHVVALFRRLNVKNRAMAVSKGLALKQEIETAPAVVSLPLDTALPQPLLARWPCLVLSVALAEKEAGRLKEVHRLLSALAIECDAVFFARNGAAGEVIFGIQSPSATERQKAFALADSALKEAPYLKMGMSAGLAMVSVDKQGRWSGEVLATAAIVAARHLAEDCPKGQLKWDEVIDAWAQEEQYIQQEPVGSSQRQIESMNVEEDLSLWVRMFLASYVRMDFSSPAYFEHTLLKHPYIVQPIWLAWLKQSAIDASIVFPLLEHS